MRMSNEEAINLLNQIRYILLDNKSCLPRTHDLNNEAIDMAISALQAQDLQPTCNQLATDCVSRQAPPDALEKCYTCKHVYQRVNGADTLFYRCRRGCKYEEFKPKRSNGNSQ